MAKLTLTTDDGVELASFDDVTLDTITRPLTLGDVLFEIQNALRGHEGLTLTPAEETDRAIRNRLDAYATPSGIRLLRKARGMTQARLAERVRVRTNTIARWERGERRPAGSTRDRLLDWIKDGGR